MKEWLTKTCVLFDFLKLRISGINSFLKWPVYLIYVGHLAITYLHEKYNCTLWSSFLALPIQLNYSNFANTLEFSSRIHFFELDYRFPTISKHYSLTPKSSNKQFFHQINRLNSPPPLEDLFSSATIRCDFHKLDFYLSLSLCSSLCHSVSVFAPL